MLVKIIAEIITNVNVTPDDVINSDTIGDYKAELDCDVGNSALTYIANSIPEADVKIISAEPFDVGVEEYGSLLNNYQQQYNIKLKKFLEKHNYEKKSV